MPVDEPPLANSPLIQHRHRFPGYDPPRVTLALEQSLLAEFTAATLPARTIVWESAPALVVSLSDKQLPRYANAANASAAEGWPVAVRSSGGTAGALGPRHLRGSVPNSFERK